MRSSAKPLKTDMDYERRFGGIKRLYGHDGADRLRAAHVCIVGLGGVGSWAAEAIARTGIGRITLIDLDMVAESNTNRQLQALSEVYGQAKVDVMANRIRLINPECNIERIEDFVTVDNVASILRTEHTMVIDAIDQVRVKTSMVAHCGKQKIPIVVAGAAGGQIDPSQIRVTDLSQTTQDPLLAKLRAQLRREHSYPRGINKKFGVTAIYSLEPLRYPEKTDSCDSAGPNGLSCAGFGSSVCVTAAFGLAAASAAINHIAKAK